MMTAADDWRGVAKVTVKQVTDLVENFAGPDRAVTMRWRAAQPQDFLEEQCGSWHVHGAERTNGVSGLRNEKLLDVA